MNNTNTITREIKGYEVVDFRQGFTLKTYTKEQRKYAYRYADKMDLAYGAITTNVNVIWA